MKFDIIDSVDYVKVERDDIISVEDKEGGGQSLTAWIRATYSGKVTKNNAMYLPDKMKSSVTSFYTPHNKPFLTHHDDSKDPIGRIVDAVYVDTSKEARAFKDSVISDSALELLNGTKSLMGQIRAVEMIDNTYSNVFASKDFPGLGYARIKAVFSDPQAIEKIKDGRYLTVSIKASTNRALCSCCKQDWVTDGPCDHERGEVYDGVRCVLITGDLDYSECSYVNMPAMDNAATEQILEDKTAEVKDSVDTKDSYEASEAIRQILQIFNLCEWSECELLTPDQMNQLKSMIVSWVNMLGMEDKQALSDKLGLTKEVIVEKTVEKVVKDKNLVQEIEALTDDLKALQDKYVEACNSNKSLKIKYIKVKDSTKDPLTLKDMDNSSIDTIISDLESSIKVPEITEPNGEFKDEKPVIKTFVNSEAIKSQYRALINAGRPAEAQRLWDEAVAKDLLFL